MEGPGAGDDGHGGEVNGVLDGCDLRIAPCQPCSAPKVSCSWMVQTYDQIADENLHDLCCQTSPSRKHPLQYADQEVAQWRADEGAVRCHFGHAGVDIMAGWADIFCDPGG